MSLVGTGRSARKTMFFYIFTRVFAHFPHFTIFSYVEQIKICLLKVFTECNASVLSPHTGVITSRIKENTAALHLI